MKLFSRWRRNRRGRLEIQAENLVATAKIHATVAYTSMGDRYEFVYSTPTELWDFLVTVAGVFVAATRANHIGLPQPRIDSLMAIVARDLEAWHPEGIAAFEDCRAFFDRNVDRIEKDKSYGQQSDLAGSDAIGIWIAWNLVEHAPQSDQEWALARTLGVLVTHSFYGWWSDEPAD